jgi:hypothetical protein
MSNRNSHNLCSQNLFLFLEQTGQVEYLQVPRSATFFTRSLPDLCFPLFSSLLKLKLCLFFNTTLPPLFIPLQLLPPYTLCILLIYMLVSVSSPYSNVIITLAMTFLPSLFTMTYIVTEKQISQCIWQKRALNKYLFK